MMGKVRGDEKRLMIRHIQYHIICHCGASVIVAACATGSLWSGCGSGGRASRLPTGRLVV